MYVGRESERVRHKYCAGRTHRRFQVEGIEKMSTVNRSPEIGGLLHVGKRVVNWGLNAMESMLPDRGGQK